MIYDFYLASLLHYDAFDIANKITFSSRERCDLHQHKSFSLIFAHPTIFAEAFPGVVKIHRSVFYDLSDLVHFGKEHSFLYQTLTHVVLDLGKCSARQMKSAIRSLSRLSGLRLVEIYIPKAAEKGGIALPKAVCRYCNFQSLLEIEVLDGGAEKKEAREHQRYAREDLALADIEKALGRQDLDDSVGRNAAMQLEVKRLEIGVVRTHRRLDRFDEKMADMYKSTPAKRLKHFNKDLHKIVGRMQDARPQGPCRCSRPKSVADESRGKRISSDN